ncbi:MAG: Hsp20/alpha crystallin family protein [Spirochaetaceae bacterium]|jgi:HSP20 family protein|nr:Hsp20/alpha crystallin family protein [Spirochaetaceae bacterium]
MQNTNRIHPINLGQTMVDIDRFMESFFGESPFSRNAEKAGFLPAVDVQETNDAYLLQADLPGLDEKDVEVNIDGGRLSIESKCSVEQEAKSDEKKYILRERRVGLFRRDFHLPENADPEAITASFKNGVLSLEVKKRTEAQRRSIPISK